MTARTDDRISMKSTARQSLSRCRKEDRPRELVGAARDIFAEKGFAATRLEDIATRAGVSKGTIYLYFKNKEALFKAVIEAGLAPVVETIETATAKDDRPAIELLHGYFGALQRIMHETPMASSLKLLVTESGNFPALAQWFEGNAICRAKTVLTNIVEAGIASGDFRPVAADAVTNIFFLLIWLCAFEKAWGSFTSPERFFEEAFDMLTRGIVNLPTN